MTAPKVSLAIIVPTANRAGLAIKACESILGQPDWAQHILVSNNSTDPAEVEHLADYCDGVAPRVTHLRPQEPLRMATHWDWALRQAMERTDATHFCIHYDRKITKPNELSLLRDLAAEFPDDLITTMIDAVVNLSGRSRLGHTAWDGRVYAVPTSHVVTMTSEGKITELGQALPLLSNCTVPRSVLLRIIDRFGSICDSTTPDSCFAYRFCATHDRYLHFDRAIGVLYGYHRSVGVGYLRGQGGDFQQFMHLWGDRPWLDAAPIPGLTLGQNILFHEYELVRRAIGGAPFKPIQMDGYLRELGQALMWVNDPVRAAEIVNLLTKHGWNAPVAALSSGAPRALRVRDGLPWARTLVHDLWNRGNGVINEARRRGGVSFRRMRARVQRLLADHLQVRPRNITDFEFTTDEEALRYALAWPRPRSETNFLDWMRHVGVDVTPSSIGDRASV